MYNNLYFIIHYSLFFKCITMRGNNKLIATYKIASFDEISEVTSLLEDMKFFYDYERVVPACLPSYIGICDNKEYVELLSYFNFNKDIKEFTDKNEFLEFAKSI